MTDDDTPDIPPALTPEQWEGREFAAVGPASNVRFLLGAPPMLVISQDGARHIGLSDVSNIAALIAIANDVLRRFDDPRAILRQHIALLRHIANRCATDLIDGSDRDYAGEVYELADALESYLPPAEAD